MVITHAEGRLKTLTAIWMILFAGGTIAIAVAIWLPEVFDLATRNPFFAVAWVGQFLLYSCSIYLSSGIRDNELTAPVLVWYKVISGTVMMLLLLKT